MQTKVFRMSVKTKTDMGYGLIAGIILAAITTYAALFAPPREKNQFPALLCVMLLGYGTIVFFCWMIRMCNAHIEITETHVTQYTPNKPPVVLAWSEITEIKNNTSMQRLELRSSERNMAVMVEHQVENFDALRQIITDKTQKPLA
ncbi:MAG TPA: hypothetical protein VF681_03540 [Abditibacteriaceae bacterium]|jgi:hypothetical protein